MKKRLEAELISIAHRILKLKNKSELSQLYFETQKLYETLSVLKFVEENIGVVQSKMDVADIEEKLHLALDKIELPIESELPQVNSEVFQEVNEATEPESKVGFDDAIAAVSESEIAIEKEEINDEDDDVKPNVSKQESVEVPDAIKIPDPDFKPSFELSFEEKSEEKSKTQQISFEDLLGADYNDPVFDKLEANKNPIAALPDFEPEASVEKPKKELFEEKSIPKPDVANDIPNRNITFGLNDRIGFEKQLFAGSSEDMNRVVSQLSTFDTFLEVQEFIEDMVKPDYNNWEGKDDYALRFMEIVEKKFG